MHLIANPVVILASIFWTLGVLSASSQSGLDSMLRDLGERAIEEIVRPDPPQVVAPPPTTPRLQAPTASSGPTRTEVMEVQQLLVELGYNPGVPDGLMGPNTARAISAFQRDAALPGSGTVTDGLIARLRIAAAGSSGGGVGTASQDAAPSFNCDRASTPTEFAICGSPELARLDRQLAEAYNQALEDATDLGRIRIEQRAWLESRNRCGGNAACLSESMTGRLAVLGQGWNTRQADGTPETASPNVTDAQPSFGKDVYLLRFSQSGQPSDGSSTVVYYNTGNLDASEAEILTPAIADAISASPRLTGVSMGPPDLAVGALVYDAYALVAGDWRNRATYAIESRHPDVNISVIQIAQAAGTDPTGAHSDGGSAAALQVADFAADDRPLLRAWLPHYLDRSTDAEQVEVIESYIIRLQGSHDYSANLLFGEGEIEGRQAGFLAREVHDRWRDALRMQVLEPPFTMRVQGAVRNLDYDYDSGELALFSDYDTPRTYHQSISHTILQDDIIESGGLARTVDNLGVRPPPFPLIGLDRELPTRFPMSPGRVEEMIVNRDIVIYEATLRVTSVSEREDDRGAHRLLVDTELVGLSVKTNAGAQIVAYAAEDLPRIASPEPEAADDAPVFETVHLARPRDILASVAARTGYDAAALIESVYPATSQDAFAKTDEIADISASSREIDLGAFWMSGYGQLADYERDNGEYGLEYVVLTYPDSVTRNEEKIRRRDLLRLANVSDDSGIRFAMSEDEARQLRDAMQGSDARFRARLATPVLESDNSSPELPLNAQLVEIVFLSPGSDPSILNPENVVARVSPTPSLSADQEDGRVATGDGGSADEVMSEAYDILGVRVGQPMSAGLSLAQAEFGPDMMLHGRREKWIGAKISLKFDPTTPLAESVILIRNSNRDFLTIFHEPLLEEDPITGVARTMTFAEGARPTQDAIRKILVDKYGEIGNERPSVYVWSRTRQAPTPAVEGEMSVGDLIAQSTAEQNRKTQMFVCSKELGSIAMAVEHDVQSSTRTGYAAFDTDYPVVDEAGEPAPYPAARPLWPVDVSNIVKEKCDTDMVLAAIQKDAAGRVAELRVLVTSRAYLAMIEADAEAALREHNAAKQEAPEIDF